MKFESRIEGGKELEAFLKSFPVKTERRFLVAGLRGPVKMIKSRIRSEISSSFRKRTGILMRSIKHKAVKARFGAAIIIQMGSIENETKGISNKFKRREKIKKLKAKKTAGKFKDAYYAKFLISGTKTKSGRSRIKSTPFLDTALNAEAPRSIDSFQSSIISAFKKEAAKMLLK